MIDIGPKPTGPTHPPKPPPPPPPPSTSQAYGPRARFFERVSVVGTCWRWTGTVTKAGYGKFGVGRVVYNVHRWAYEQFVGPIPAEMTIDHTCHNRETCPGGITCLHRRCVNPEHLEAVTQKVNVSRGHTGRTNWPAYVERWGRQPVAPRRAIIPPQPEPELRFEATAPDGSPISGDIGQLSDEQISNWISARYDIGWTDLTVTRAGVPLGGIARDPVSGDRHRWAA